MFHVFVMAYHTFSAVLQTTSASVYHIAAHAQGKHVIEILSFFISYEEIKNKMKC